MGIRNLKLWMTKTIHGYDIPDCKESQPLKIKPEDKIMVLAPHADDETIGCGGFLLKYGKQCDIVLLTDGRHSDVSIDPNIMIDVRKKEFEAVVSRYNARQVRMLNVEDGRLIDCFKDFSTLDFKEYDYVLMPHPADAHKDHVAVNCLFKRLSKTRPFKGQVVYYEIWNTLVKPTHYVDISDVVTEKRRLINMYHSQIKNIDYASRILGLNHYRGMRHNVEYEEDFEVVKI